MPEVNGRLICCTCGADLGDASDPYRDPDCGECLKVELESEREQVEADEIEQELSAMRLNVDQVERLAVALGYSVKEK